MLSVTGKRRKTFADCASAAKSRWRSDMVAYGGKQPEGAVALGPLIASSVDLAQTPEPSGARVAPNCCPDFGGCVATLHGARLG